MKGNENVIFRSSLCFGITQTDSVDYTPQKTDCNSWSYNPPFCIFWQIVGVLYYTAVCTQVRGGNNSGQKLKEMKMLYSGVVYVLV
jgi:hypothetical protein